MGPVAFLVCRVTRFPAPTAAVQQGDHCECQRGPARNSFHEHERSCLPMKPHPENVWFGLKTNRYDFASELDSMAAELTVLRVQSSAADANSTMIVKRRD